MIFSKDLKYLVLFSAVFSLVLILRSNENKFLNQSDQKERNLQTSSSQNSMIKKYCLSGLSLSVTSSQKSQADQVSSSIKSIRGSDNQLIKAIKEGGSAYNTYATNLIPYTAEWIVLWIISAIGTLCYYICCCCDGCCPPKCCRRDLELKPFTKNELTVPLYVVIFFSVGLIGVGIAGFIISPQVIDGINTFQCSMSTITDNFLYGVNFTIAANSSSSVNPFSNTTIVNTSSNTNTSTKGYWVGLYPVISTLQIMQSQVTDASQQFSAAFNETYQQYLQSQKELILNDTIQVFSNNSQLTTNTPNPASSSSNQVNSNFVQNLMGPVTTQGTMSYLLKQVLDSSTSAYIQIIQQLSKSATFLTQSSNSIVTSLASGQSSISSYNNDLLNYQKTLQDFLDAANSYFGNITYGLYAYFGVTLLAAILSIFAGISIAIFNNLKLRILLHFAWGFMSLLMFIGFVLASFLFPVNIVIYDFCDFYKLLTSSQQQFQSYPSIIPDVISQNASTCLFGNGNMAPQFGLTNSLSIVNNVNNQFSSFSSANNPISSSYINLASSNAYIQQWMTTMGSYQQGLIADGAPVQTADNAQIALTNFNQYASSIVSGTQQSSCTSKTQDTWVFNSQNCSSQVVSSSSPSSNLGSASCLQVSAFSSGQQSSRYSSQPAGCTSVKSALTSNFQYLSSYDQSRQTVFKTINSSLAQLYTDNNNLVNSLNIFSVQLTNLQSNVQGLLTSIGDPVTGIANSFNCGFLSQLSTQLYNNLCISFFVPFYLITVFLITISCICLVTSCLSWTSAMRYLKTNPQNNNQVQVQYQQNDQLYGNADGTKY